MKSLILFVSLCIASSLAGEVALAKIVPGGDATIAGWIRFETVDTGVNVTVTVTGITTNSDGLHGIHIHTWGDIRTVAGTNTGTHYNPLNSTHGCEGNTTRHIGDLGNWQATGGNIQQWKVLNLLTLAGANSIIGRGVIIHSTFDDCSLAPTGNSGTRIGQGVIGIANEAANIAVQANNGFTKAVAVLTPTVGNTVAGYVFFERLGQGIGTRVRAVITGLVDGSQHGFHIHQFGDLRGTDALTAGGHWNPENVAHGIPPVVPRHAGDLGNLYHYQSGSAYFDQTNDYVRIDADPTNIIGRAVIVHQNKDNCTGAVGFAGSRYAIGVIGVMDPTQSFTEYAPASAVPTTQDTSQCPVAPTATTVLATTKPSDSSSSQMMMSMMGLFVICLGFFL